MLPLEDIVIKTENLPDRLLTLKKSKTTPPQKNNQPTKQTTTATTTTTKPPKPKRLTLLFITLYSIKFESIPWKRQNDTRPH